jgi:orotate phosphoribosyltransferase
MMNAGELAPVQSGHFQTESGFHTNLWMDLEALFLHPARLEPAAAELALRLRAHGIEAVCGPLVEGAFLALMVARELGVPFTYSERYERDAGALYPYGYRIPRTLHEHVRGRRVAIVNDVISAGSAVRGTWIELEALEAKPVAIAALLVTAAWTSEFAREKNIAAEILDEKRMEIWPPEQCPLCQRGEPLTPFAASS